jgi:hypothetical protein
MVGGSKSGSCGLWKVTFIWCYLAKMAGRKVRQVVRRFFCFLDVLAELLKAHPTWGECRRTAKGGRRKKKMTKATYICRSAKKKVVTYFILFLFLFLFFIDFF